MYAKLFTHTFAPFAGKMLGKQNPYVEQSWIIHDYHNPWALRIRPPSSTECPDAAGRVPTFTRARSVGFGGYVATGNFYMAIKVCRLLVQPNLPRNTSWILIWCSCSCEPLVLPRHDLNVTLNVLIEAVTRHLPWGTKNCLWVMSPREPWHIWKFNELIICCIQWPHKPWIKKTTN